MDKNLIVWVITLITGVDPQVQYCLTLDLPSPSLPAVTAAIASLSSDENSSSLILRSASLEEEACAQLSEVSIACSEVAEETASSSPPAPRSLLESSWRREDVCCYNSNQAIMTKMHRTFISVNINFIHLIH